MDELFNILSSSARINKSKKKKKVAPPAAASTALVSQPISNDTTSSYSYTEDDSEGGRKSRDLTGKRDRTPAKLDQIHREDVAAFRNRLSIRLSALNRHDLTLSDPITTFDELAQPAWWLNQPQLFSAVKNTLLKNIEMGKWTEPTPIQMQSIPTLLEKRDTLGCAPTGSGKSGAFIIPALFIGSAPQSVFYNTSVAPKSDSVDGGKKKKKKNKHQEKHGDPDTEGGIRTLLLAPSRELAAQLHREVVRLGEGKIHGLKSVLLSKPNTGVVISGKAGGKRGLDVLVSTPLRLVECIRQGIDLSRVRLVVLDEADRLLDVADGGGTKHTNNEKNTDQTNDLKDGSISEDSESSDDSPSSKEEETPQNSKNQADPIQQQQSGSRQTQTFLAQIDAILSHIPTSAIRGLFSATITPPVRSLSESMLRNPVDITIGGGSSGPSANTDIDQKLMFVGREEGKLLAIR
jgi:ATP-dependent RNA helicase DDX52/ROK1